MLGSTKERGPILLASFASLKNSLIWGGKAAIK